MKKLLLALSVASIFSGYALANAQPTHEVAGGDGSTLGSSTSGITGAPGPAVPAVGYQKGASGEFSFSGIVTARTCEIKSPSAVQLGTVSANAINDQKAPEVDFDIVLSGCGESYTDRVSVMLEPRDVDVDDQGALINLSSDDDNATSAVLLLKKVESDNTTPIDLSGSDEERTFAYKTLNGGNGKNSEYVFKLKAQLTAPADDNARAGIFTGRLPFTVVYK